MQAAVIDIYITGMVNIHYLRLMPGNSRFDLLDQIETI